MKSICKLFLSLFLLLLLFALSACTPSIPSDLTAPPSESIPEKTEFIPNSLDGIGTICDIVEYKGGYLILAHSGLYTVDRDFENRERLGAPYNSPFDDCEEYSFFHRLTAVPNYDDQMLDNLDVNGEHIFFCCPVTNSFFIDGKETKLSDCGLLPRYSGYPQQVTPVAYHDTFYAYYKPLNTMYIIHEGQYIEIDLEYDGKSYYRLYEHDDKLYLLGCEPFPNNKKIYRMELHEDLTLGESVRTTDEESDYAFRSGTLVSGKYSYTFEQTDIMSEPDENGSSEFLGYDYAFYRTDGETVETLVCDGAKNLFDAADRHFCFIKNDSQFYVITLHNNHANLSILDFSVKQ